MSVQQDDPSSVSEETLRAFEADMVSSDAGEPAQPRRGGRQGPMILVGMVACIVFGVASLLFWLM